MTKEQFIEVLSDFVVERLVEALAEQAENKGYFDEVKYSGLPQKVVFDVGFPNSSDSSDVEAFKQCESDKNKLRESARTFKDLKERVPCLLTKYSKD